MAKKETGKALVKWEDEFAQYAKESAVGAKVAEAKFISFGGGRMSFGGAEIPDGKLRCVVVGWTHANAYYDPDVPFDPKDPQTPLCYAFGNDEDEMQPHENSPEPQCAGCADCPYNQFESAQRGRGKACKNGIRLALIAESDLEDLSEAEVVYASIPPKSIKNWTTYVGRTLKDTVKRPHWAVVTMMTRVPDSESQFRVTFEVEELIDDSSLFPELKSLWERTKETIGFAYAVREKKEPEKSVKKTNKFAKRK